MKGSKLELWACEKYSDGEHLGINLAHGYLFGDHLNQFIEETKNALDLIHTHDERRFQRLKENVKHIMCCELSGFGEYLKGGIIKVDITKLDFKNNLIWSRYMIAACFIHEATHGHLFSKGIKYNKRTRIRCERICRSEENHFLAQFPECIENDWLLKFNENDWPSENHFTRTLKLMRAVYAGAKATSACKN